MEKKTILVVGPLPLPYNGMTVVTKKILDSEKFNETFKVLHLDTSDHRDVQNIGNLDFLNIYFAFKNFFVCFYLLLMKKIDYFYIPNAQNNLGYLRDSLLLILAKFFKKYIIVHFHGGYFYNFYKNTNFFMQFLVRFTLKNVKKIVVLGECLKYNFEEFIDKKNIYAVSNGVKDEFRNFDYDILAKKNNKFTILFLSNLTKNKGIFHFLDLALELKIFEDINFVCAGEWHSDIEKKQALDFCKKNGLNERVSFSGRIDGECKRNLFLTSSLFYMPTLHEGQPLVILEAMSAGLPVIAFDRGCIKETVKTDENGFVLSSETKIEEIKNLVLKFYNDRNFYNEFVKNSRTIYENNYTDEKFIDNLIKAILN